MNLHLISFQLGSIENEEEEETRRKKTQQAQLF